MPYQRVKSSNYTSNDMLYQHAQNIPTVDDIEKSLNNNTMQYNYEQPDNNPYTYSEINPELNKPIMLPGSGMENFNYTGTTPIPTQLQPYMVPSQSYNNPETQPNYLSSNMKGTVIVPESLTYGGSNPVESQQYMDPQQIMYPTQNIIEDPMENYILSKSTENIHPPTNISENFVKSPQKSMDCVECSNHISNCPVCSKLYRPKSIWYIIAIIVLFVICIFLLKKVLDKK